MDIFKDHDEDIDYEVEIDQPHLKKIRIIKYIINNKPYYLGTNLYDSNSFNHDTLVSIYKKRWSSEEMFKMLKSYTNMNNINEKSYDRICKSIYCHSIISKLQYLFKNYYEDQIKDNIQKNKNKIKKVNQSCLIDYIYDTGFLCELFLGKIDIISLNKLSKNIKYVISNINISNPRHCKRSTYLSYFRYNNKKKSKKTTENNVEDENNIIENENNIIENENNIIKNENKIKLEV